MKAYEEVIKILSPESIKKAFKKVKEDITSIKNELEFLKQNQINHAEVMREIIEKFDDINKLKMEVNELKNTKQFFNKENEKLLMNLHKKIEFLLERVNDLEKENLKLKEENEFLKKDLLRITKMMKGIVELKEEVY
jgi:DNA repair exonuclease SbcCD ATPase subunit